MAMQLKITHETTYTYDSEVFPEPHVLRFRPLSGPNLSLRNYEMHIIPEPAGISDFADPEGNYIQSCWFNGTTRKICFSATSRIESLEFNPFDFLIHPVAFTQFPFTYNRDDRLLLAPALETIPCEKIIRWSSRIAAENDYQTLGFLVELTRAIHEEFEVKNRETGSPLNPDEVFAEKAGSCRDLAWMQIQAVRAQGMAARFVSGYFYFESENPLYELHAWLEVYLPGAGWIGFDPSHGMITGSGHIPLCRSAMHEHTLPVSGSIRGDAKSHMQSILSIEQI